ncbi:riboflavin kinase-like [Hydractinia symbiolongicarpus]|uniref:riboflavin kinase-like n=1 Tax=Hydractinia symbiolongicarpus TaxID=13093 RepID=UPI00254AAFD9|nr:riboflavin kinase-like [Hydractinia symbiolongicarpus]
MSSKFATLNKRLLSNPHFAEGLVVKGFGRGSKELGIPTANYPEEVVNNLPDDIATGVYYGWSRVNNGDIFKMVLSVGWNPYYKNEKKSMETHILHSFADDFYGSTLRITMTGYIRPEENFNSLDELIKAIQNDIKVADEALEKAEHKELKQNLFLTADK